MTSWIWNMAWRESRSNISRLALFIAAIVMGVAALVSITSFGENLDRAVEEQSKTLLGADLQIESRLDFSAEALALLDSIGGEQVREVRFSSMAYLPAARASRLSQIRAIEPGFPFYGELETIPAQAKDLYQNGYNALVDEGLMIQYGAEIGDSIRIGLVGYRIAGRLISIPGESVAQGIAGPRIFIPYRTVEETGLLQRGSQLYHNIYFRFDEGTDTDARISPYKQQLDRLRLDADTVKDRKESLGRALTNLTRFLNLVGFIALLLGGVGIASSIHVYIRKKLNTVAVLRCLGASTKQSTLIYVTQAMVMGMAGAAVGSAAGIGVQFLLPVVLKDFLPVDLEIGVSWVSVWWGFIIGIGITALFALQPLVSIRNISPLLAIRQSYEQENTVLRDPLRWVIYGVTGLGILAFSLLLTENIRFGFGYFGAIAAAFASLTLIAWAVMKLFRRWFPRGSRFEVRQGIANLYRPNNQTMVMIVTLGFGTFLIALLFLVRDVLLNQINVIDSSNQPNLVLYDIQSDQRDGIRSLIEDRNMDILQDVPIVTMRISAINGERLEDIREKKERRVPNWMYEREMRVTYRSELSPTEKLVKGEWIPEFNDLEGVIPLSIELGVFEDLDFALGDTILFNVQGIPVTTRITSVREVNWQQVSPNFVFVFPEGVIEEAPVFYVQVLKTPNREASGELQRSVISAYPNVSAIDLDLVLAVADGILSRVSFVIQFMALFSVITGLIVLSGAVVASRFQRARESVLLKTLGSSGRQVLWIMSVEYLVLGLLSAFTGILLALGGTWALSITLFETTFVPNPVAIAGIFITVMTLTLVIGIANSRDIYRKSPLEVLRAEG